jgi:hypothetical protein
VQALKARVAPLGCTVTTSLLFREPVAQYVSFYRYYIQKMQAADSAAGPGQPRGREAWGDTILDWASVVPDIQVRVVHTP